MEINFTGCNALFTINTTQLRLVSPWILIFQIPTTLKIKTAKHHFLGIPQFFLNPLPISLYQFILQCLLFHHNCSAMFLQTHQYQSAIAGSISFFYCRILNRIISKPIVCQSEELIFWQVFCVLRNAGYFTLQIEKEIFNKAFLPNGAVFKHPLFP